MKEIILICAGAVGGFILCKYLQNKTSALLNKQAGICAPTPPSVTTNAATAPPISKSTMLPSAPIQPQPDNSTSKFNINVADPKFGNGFFNYGQTVYNQ